MLLQAGDLSGQVVRKQVEIEATILCPPRRFLGAGAVAATLGVTAFGDLGKVDAVPLLVDDVGELAGDLVVHIPEIEPLETISTGLTQALEQLAQTGDGVAIGCVQPVVHQSPQGGVDIPVLDQVVGNRRQDVVGVRLEPALRPIPPRVRVPERHGPTVSVRHHLNRAGGGFGGRRLPPEPPDCGSIRLRRSTCGMDFVAGRRPALQRARRATSGCEGESAEGFGLG